MRHGRGHLQLSLAFVFAKNIAAQQLKALAARLTGRAGHNDFGYQVRRVLAHLKHVGFLHHGVGGLFNGVGGWGHGYK